MAPKGSLVAWTWACMRPYRGRMVLLVAIAVTEIVLVALGPWPMKIVVDNVFGSYPMPAPLSPIMTVLGGSKANLLLAVVVGGLLLSLLAQLVSMFNTQV